MIFREKDTGRVQFIKRFILYTFLIENILSKEKTVDEIFVDIIYLFGISDKSLLQTKIINFLQDLKIKGFIIGFDK